MSGYCLYAWVNLPESPYDEVEAEPGHGEPVDRAPDTAGRTGGAGPPPTPGRTVGRAAVGGPVTPVELDGAKPAAAPWRKRIIVGLVLVALAVGLPVILAATRPTGPIALPLPPGLATPITGGGGPGPLVPPPPGPATPDPSGTGPGTGDPTAPGSDGVPGVPGGPGVPGAPNPAAPAARTQAPAPGTSAVPPVPAPVAKPLTAGYETVAHTGLLGLTGYQGQVTIRNPGQVAVSGWTVTISLPAGETVNGATGAAYSQHGTTVTFTPSGGTGTVPAGGSVRFTFGVGGLLAGDPTGCAIDGRGCA